MSALLVLVLSIQIATVNSSTVFRDDFNDLGNWTVSAPGCPGKICSASNVAIKTGFLVITVPAGRQGGGEVSSKGAFRYGSFQASMKISKVAWVRFAFFLFDPTTQNEIDVVEIEVGGYAGNSVSAYSTVWRDPNHRIWTSGAYNLWFDPSGGYHTYRLDYYQSKVQFYIDGRCVSTVPMSLVPFAPMRIYLNAYTFMPFSYPTFTATFSVDWVQVSS